MAATQQTDDLLRSLVKHQHDHPPPRNLNDLTTANRPRRMASELARAAGSWGFVILQGTFIAVWLILNAIAGLRHWDPYPFNLLDLAIAMEALAVTVLVLMALNRLADRDVLRAEHDFQDRVRLEEELRAVMSHLEAQDELLVQLLSRLDRTDRELRRLARGQAQTEDADD